MSECMLFELRAFTADKRRNTSIVHKSISVNTSQRVDVLIFIAKCSERELENSIKIMKII